MITHTRIAEDMSAHDKPRALHIWFSTRGMGPSLGLWDFEGLITEVLQPFRYRNIATLEILVLDEDYSPLLEFPQGLSMLRAAVQVIAEVVLGYIEATIEREEHWEFEGTWETAMQHWYQVRPSST